MILLDTPRIPSPSTAKGSQRTAFLRNGILLGNKEMEDAGLQPSGKTIDSGPEYNSSTSIVPRPRVWF